MKNNESRATCSILALERGWIKEKMRNVVTVDGEKWSFSVSSDTPQCRQTYEDTVGFITLTKTGDLMKYRVKSYAWFSVSRISPKGIRAYNVSVKKKEMQPFN